MSLQFHGTNPNSISKRDGVRGTSVLPMSRSNSGEGGRVESNLVVAGTPRANVVNGNVTVVESFPVVERLPVVQVNQHAPVDRETCLLNVGKCMRPPLETFGWLYQPANDGFWLYGLIDPSVGQASLAPMVGSVIPCGVSVLLGLREAGVISREINCLNACVLMNAPQLGRDLGRGLDVTLSSQLGRMAICLFDVPCALSTGSNFVGHPLGWAPVFGASGLGVSACLGGVGTTACICFAVAKACNPSQDGRVFVGQNDVGNDAAQRRNVPHIRGRSNGQRRDRAGVAPVRSFDDSDIVSGGSRDLDAGRNQPGNRTVFLSSDDSSGDIQMRSGSVVDRSAESITSQQREAMDFLAMTMTMFSGRKQSSRVYVLNS